MSETPDTSLTRIVDVDGWLLNVAGDEPRIRDVDLAERAGLKQPRATAVVAAKAAAQSVSLARMARMPARLGLPPEARGILALAAMVGTDPRELPPVWAQ